MRERTPSLPKTCERWPSTVRSERNSAAATSRFVFPSATRAATRSSAGVSAPGVGRAPADPAQLRARALGPERGADPLEDGERLLERLARLAPALRPTLRGAEREQRPAAVERELDRSHATRAPPRSAAAPRRASPRCAASSPRQRRQDGKRRRTLEPAARSPSYQSRSSTASSSRPSSISASIWSTTKRSRTGLDDRLPPHERDESAREPRRPPPRDRRARARGARGARSAMSSAVPAPSRARARAPRRAARRLVDLAELRLRRGSRARGVCGERARCPDCSAASCPFASTSSAFARSPSAHSTCAEQSEHVRARALVAELVARRSELDEARRERRPGRSVHIQCSAAANERLVRGRDGPSASWPARRGPAVAAPTVVRPSSASAVTLRHERLCGERLVAELERESQRRVSACSTDLLEPLAEPEEARRRHAFVRDREDLAIVLPPHDAWRKSSAASVWRVVRADARKTISGSRPLPSRRRSGSDHVAELRLGPRRVPRLEVEVRGLDGAAKRVRRADLPA